jgi:hypothetical protein
MASSTLILDRSIPEVDQLVAGWKDGGVYTLELKVRQLAADESRTTLHVDEVSSMDGGEAEEPEEEVMTKAPKTMGGMPKMVEEEE